MKAAFLNHRILDLESILQQRDTQISNLYIKVIETQSQNEDLQQRNKQLEEQLRLYKAALYGKKTEKRHQEDNGQLSLFDETQEETPAETTEKTNKTHVKPHKRNKPGRKPIPADLPRVEQIYDIPEEEKICACGALLTRIGEEVDEKLDIIPAKIQVLRNIRPKYACRKCEGTSDETKGAVRIADLPPQLIPQGIVTERVIAYIIIAKYADAIPLYRQEQQFLRLGLDISRGTLCSWIMFVANLCKRLSELLMEDILNSPIINMDETTVQVMKEPGRKNTTKSYMWVCRGGQPGRPGIIFRYFPSRSSEVVKEILSGYSGYLQTDGYSGYDIVGNRQGVVHLGCLSHVRRKFMDVQKACRNDRRGGIASDILDLIGKVYGVEDKAIELKLDYDGIFRLRNEEAVPILDKIKAILDSSAITTPPKVLLGKAIRYALNQWSRVLNYLKDGRLRPDNNIVENDIRPFAVGRKNWLFAGSPKGAEASAIIYSLMVSAKANNLEPYSYFSYLFSKLPTCITDDDLRALLPNNIDRSLIQPLHK